MLFPLLTLIFRVIDDFKLPIVRSRYLRVRDSSSPGYIGMNEFTLLHSKEKGFPRKRFLFNFVPPFNRERNSFGISLEERTSPPWTLKNGWKRKPGCTFREHKNLRIYLDRHGNRPPWFRRSRCYKASRCNYFTRRRKKKEEEEEEEKTKWLLSKFCTLPIASIGFRFFVSTFVSLNFAGDKERGRVITGG